MEKFSLKPRYVLESVIPTSPIMDENGMVMGNIIRTDLELLPVERDRLVCVIHKIIRWYSPYNDRKKVESSCLFELSPYEIGGCSDIADIVENMYHDIGIQSRHLEQLLIWANAHIKEFATQYPLSFLVDSESEE